MKITKYNVVTKGTFAFNGKDYTTEDIMGDLNGISLAGGKSQWSINYRQVEEALGLDGQWSRTPEKMAVKIMQAMVAKKLTFKDLTKLQDEVNKCGSMIMAYGMIQRTPLSSIELINV